jgi:hypothetical protein
MFEYWGSLFREIFRCAQACAEPVEVMTVGGFFYL